METEKYMRRCLDLARQGEYYVAPNPMVGAVLVGSDGQILGEGHTSPYGGPHAEVNAFGDFHKRHSALSEAERRRLLNGATLYVSLEPCSHYGKTPPCADRVIREGVGHVVVGCLDPNPLVAGRGVGKLRDAGIEVETGLLERECRYLNRRFICLHEKHRPYVVLKWAQTADGFLAPLPTCEGEEQRLVISTPLTRQLVHKMRAENMAIMVGTNTVVKDNPQLLNTHWCGRNPIRVVLDRHHRLDPRSRVFSDDATTIVYSDNTEWQFILSDLARRNIHSVLVEGGAELLHTIIASDVFDEVHVEVGQMKIGEGVAAPSMDLSLFQCTRIDSNRLYEYIRS